MFSIEVSEIGSGSRGDGLTLFATDMPSDLSQRTCKNCLTLPTRRRPRSCLFIEFLHGVFVNDNSTLHRFPPRRMSVSYPEISQGCAGPVDPN